MKLFCTILLFAVIFSAGCGAKKLSSAEEYYATGNNYLRDGAYSMAIDNFRELLDQYPFSELAEDAEFKIAQAHFQNHSCPEAIAAFSDFQRRHPTSPFLPLVGFLIAQCHERQMQKPDRDQSAAQSAHAYYQALINQYPESPYADLASQRLQQCRDNMAEHEYNIADFYARRGNEKAAEVRLIDLVKRYNDTDQAANALYMLADIYETRQEPDKAALAVAGLLYHHRDHDLADEANQRLDALVADSGDRPVGDPVVALLARSGRFRNLDIVPAESDEVPVATDRGGILPPTRGFNQPTLDPIDSGRSHRRYD